MNPVVIIVFLIILVIVGMVVALVANNDKQKSSRALRVIRGQSAGRHQKKPKDEQERRRAEISRKLKEQGLDEDSQKKKKVTLSAQLQQAGLSLSPKIFLLIFFAIAILFGFFMFAVVKWAPLACIIAAIAGFFGFQRFFINLRINKRQKKFLSEFADALEAMVRLLKAGMPVTEAIKMVGREFEGPVGEEMARIYDAQKIGIPLPEAVLESARRMPLTEMQMFATGIAIQSQTGASLSEVLTNLAGVIRARYKLRRKVKALSSEAKASAMIIGSLPFLVGGGMYFINPAAMEPLFVTFGGKVMLGVCALLMLTGILVMRAMINFKI